MGYEFELSAQDHAELPEAALLDAIILTTDPYVPATMRKDPSKTSITFQTTRRPHLTVGCSLPLLQLSYSHIHPIGWNDMRVPSKAPISETRSLKIGMPLAMR